MVNNKLHYTRLLLTVNWHKCYLCILHRKNITYFVLRVLIPKLFQKRSLSNLHWETITLKGISMVYSTFFLYYYGCVSSGMYWLYKYYRCVCLNLVLVAFYYLSIFFFHYYFV